MAYVGAYPQRVREHTSDRDALYDGLASSWAANSNLVTAPVGPISTLAVTGISDYRGLA